jgi:hypothetical protein
MVIMGRGRTFEPETCASALMSALARSGNRASADELFLQVKKTGHWTVEIIWTELLSHTVNLPPAYHRFPATTGAQRFLFLREDGNYEMYDPTWHGRFERGKRIV